MSVLMTSSTPNLLFNTAATPAHTAPAAIPATSSSGIEIQPGQPVIASPAVIVAAAPASNWPSAPIFSTPALNATATARPTMISGVARCSVPEKTEYALPNEPFHIAPAACPMSYPATTTTSDTA